MSVEQNRDLGRRELWQWFQTIPGSLLLEAEEAELCRVLSKMFGYYALQLGAHFPANTLQACMITCKSVIDTEGRPENTITIKSVLDELPVKSDSVDLVLLPHVLEFEQDPHRVLREVDRILIAEGHLIIIGFNPLSLWGAWRMLGRLRKRPPWIGQFLSLTRIKDWLSLLGFEVREKAVFFQRPPFRHEGAMRKLMFMEHYGQHWLPSLGAVYMLVAEKKALRLTLIKPRWRTRRALVRTPPVAEGLERAGKG